MYLLSPTLEAAVDAMKVLVVDDHPLVREGLRRMLEGEPGVDVVGEASSFEEAMALAEAASPNMILMDVKMPGTNGIEATRQLKQKFPTCHIIILTLYSEFLAQAVEAGASGYLLKDIKRDDLIKAMRAVQEGKASLDLALSQELFAEFANLARGVAGERASFTDQEREILRLISQGATTKEIAVQLYASESTIKRGVRRIFDKLNAQTRAEAISEAHKKKLI